MGIEQNWKFITQIIVIGLLFTAEWFVPFFEFSKNKLTHDGRNLLLALINGLIGTFIFSSLVVSAINLSQTNNFGIVNYLEFSYLSSVLALLMFDAWMYFWHRINHKIPFLWRFHRMHHSDTEMDVTTGLRFHPGEIILSFCARLLIIPLIGISFNELVIYEVALQLVVLFHHSNVKIGKRFDSLFRLVFVSPNMHKVHHSDIQSETDSNYSTVLSIWDRIFGTYVNREDVENIDYGLKEFKDAEDQSVVGMLKTPWK